MSPGSVIHGHPSPHDDSNSISLTLTTKYPYVCFPGSCLDGSPCLGLFCIVVRVIFLAGSSGKVAFLIKMLHWFTVQ